MEVFKDILSPLTLQKFYPHIAGLTGWDKQKDSSYNLVLNPSDDLLYSSFRDITVQMIKEADIKQVMLSHVPPLTKSYKEYNKGQVLIGQLSPEWKKDWGGDLIYQRQSVAVNPGTFLLFDAPCKFTEKGANQLCLPKVNVFIELTNIRVGGSEQGRVPAV